AFILSLVITIVVGKRFINYQTKNKNYEEIRDIDKADQEKKQEIPTMGGLFIIAGIVIPVLLFSSLNNVYIQLLLVTVIWLGFIGFVDDYQKMKYRNKDGLAGKYKVIGQVVLALIVGSTLYWHPDVKIKEQITDNQLIESGLHQKKDTKSSVEYQEIRTTKTTIPFIKNNELDYSNSFLSLGKKWGWLIFIPVVVFVVVAMSNGANLTDGMDGLATGTSAIIGITLGVLAYLSGNAIFSDYLNILYIPDSGEMLIFMTAFVGATLGFLWYNAYPAQVYMGDTGSLMLGGVIAVFAISIRKELLLPCLAGIFLVENLSVLIQTYYFKYTRIKTGKGKRIFLRAPIHHHFQMKQNNIKKYDSKIVTRFFLVGLLLAVLTIVTLKLR
ncbi:MAG: phospho-N-acetylmuramoyl-pentapeptide-transferase, partial [Flavobacteriales bacterium]